MGIVLYNTMDRSKEAFLPLDGKRAGLYTCGPTVYNFAHIGNLRTYVFEDILKRVLIYNGIPVKHVMNITDVGHLTSDADEGEDKMEKGARREGRSVREIAQFYTEAFMRDLEKLRIIEPDIWCRATDHIAEQEAQVQSLVDNGFAYITSDGIYFDTSRLDDYGKLARLKLEDLKAGARVDMREKRNPTDFALWKFSSPGQQRAMEWDFPCGFPASETGTLTRVAEMNPNVAIIEQSEERVKANLKGFPGWHIECSAMSMKYLGEQFDIHCGGIDHIPVHHTNEIAQAEAASGKKPWVRFWLHGEFLVLDEGKMAKSGENFITLATLEERGFNPIHYRYLCLTAHYRQQLKFSWEAMETARNGYESIKAKLLSLKEIPQDAVPHDEGDLRPHREAFLAAANDDLNMPQALAALWEMLRDETISAGARVELSEQFDEVLGLGFRDFERLTEETVEEGGVVMRIAVQQGTPEEIRQKVINRQLLRKDKKFKEADALRDEIRGEGYLLEDIPGGSRLRKK